MSHGNKGNKGNSLTRPLRSHFCYFCSFCGTISISCGKIYCPTEIKEIAEIIVTRPREVLSAISAGLLVSHADSILLSRRNKGNKGNHVTLTLRSPFCHFCSFCGTLLSHADSIFYCPAVIGFAASLVEEIKEIKEILLPALCAAISAISALSAGHYYLMRIVFYCPDFYCPAVIGFAASLVEEIKEIKEILLPARCEAISAISVLSVGQ